MGQLLIFTGLSLVVLGMMDFLSRHVTRIGFFRPIVRSEKVMDKHIRLIYNRYNLDFEYKDMYGLTSDEMNQLIRNGDNDSIQTIILNKYKNLEITSDFLTHFQEINEMDYSIYQQAKDYMGYF